MATKNLVPRATGEGSLGTTNKKWGNIYADYITLQDGETLQTKIANQNTRITTAEGTVTTLSGDVTSLYGSVETLSSGKVDVSTYNSGMAGKVNKNQDIIIKNSNTDIGFGHVVNVGNVDYSGIFTSTDIADRLKHSRIGFGKYENNEAFFICATKDNDDRQLVGNSLGELTWGGNNIETVVASGEWHSADNAQWYYWKKCDSGNVILFGSGVQFADNASCTLTYPFTITYPCVVANVMGNRGNSWMGTVTVCIDDTSALFRVRAVDAPFVTPSYSIAFSYMIMGRWK